MSDPNEVVDIAHPDIEKTARSTRNALDNLWSKKGWRETSKPDLPDLEPFDPNEHTAAEVITHLKTAGPQETERVIALERDGKDRSSITG